MVCNNKRLRGMSIALLARGRHHFRSLVLPSLTRLLSIAGWFLSPGLSATETFDCRRSWLRLAMGVVVIALPTSPWFSSFFSFSFSPVGISRVLLFYLFFYPESVLVPCFLLLNCCFMLCISCLSHVAHTLCALSLFYLPLLSSLVFPKILLRWIHEMIAVANDIIHSKRKPCVSWFHCCESLGLMWWMSYLSMRGELSSKWITLPIVILVLMGRWDWMYFWLNVEELRQLARCGNSGGYQGCKKLRCVMWDDFKESIDHHKRLLLPVNSANHQTHQPRWKARTTIANRFSSKLKPTFITFSRHGGQSRNDGRG